VALWRRAWRDKVLPAVAAHKPDLILVSAGFDAHRKDGINHRFVGLQERDYEWLTAQIVQARTLLELPMVGMQAPC
jgi:acetoin utilization deacetylase AcuC-like enzyme